MARGMDATMAVPSTNRCIHLYFSVNGIIAPTGCNFDAGGMHGRDDLAIAFGGPRDDPGGALRLEIFGHGIATAIGDAGAKRMAIEITGVRYGTYPNGKLHACGEQPRRYLEAARALR